MGNKWDTTECGNQDFCIDCTKFEILVIPEREIKTCKITTRQMIHFLTFSCSLLFKPTLDFINNREKLLNSFEEDFVFVTVPWITVWGDMWSSRKYTIFGASASIF